MHVTVVYNSKSGTALSKSALKALFHDAAITTDVFIELNQSSRRKLKKYIDAGAIIAVVGGDGTISAVAGMIAGTQATLLPLPGGTLNHFTKDLRIDQDLAVAIKSARHGKRHLVDMALVNGVPFINNSSIGLYPSSLRDRNRFEDQLGKWPAAVIASIRSLVRYRSIFVEIDGRSFHTPFVFIGNNQYKIEGDVLGRAKLDEGLLSVFIVRTASRIELVKIFGLALIGRAANHEKFDSFAAKGVVISTKRGRIAVSHDGELGYLKSPLRYEVKHKELRILKGSR